MTRGASRPGLEEYRKKRNFSRTAEPSGHPTAAGAADDLRFVIQKHAASHLHFDLRLEMEGVMRSWAVPKGPSLDPSVRRLAMEVEDHPIEYNDFEGTIPKDEYGGGTVMLWDRGHYLPDEPKKGESSEKAALRGYRAGKLSFTFHGERLLGSFALVRTDSIPGGVRSKWLLLKHDDADADAGQEITETIQTSVVSGRTMQEIADGRGGTRVWRSNRSGPPLEESAPATGAPPPAVSGLLPMLARTGDAVPEGENWTFEPKYDGIRILAFATPGAVALVTRNGHDKSSQFPEVVASLEELARELEKPVVLDGELVALEAGRITRFEALQGRMHVKDGARTERLARATPAALVAFDVLIEGEEVVIRESWTERRSRLERLLADDPSDTIRLAESSSDPSGLLERARREGWEGIMAKRTDSTYRPGQRSADWLKIKMENRQELVIGGWTEPRGSRAFLGAILLGYYDAQGDFAYAGSTGTGFDRATLEDLHRRLKRLSRKTSPFRERPRTSEAAHWVTPKLVAEVKFNEWTREGKLRQPVFLGLRDDREPREVVREPSVGATSPESDHPPVSSGVEPDPGERPPADLNATPPTEAELDTPTSRKIRKMSERGGGQLKLGRGGSLGLTNLGKQFYPATGHTKQDLLVYYSRLEAAILPWMKDRPLVLKRFPNGVEGEAFYQQAAPDSVPEGVRVETLRIEGKKQRRLVGGNLATLLYTVQLGAISYDPWHSRVQDLESADYTILDLDPGPGATFKRVIDVARRVKNEMDALGLHGALKTSGSSGLHIYLPLPPGTPLEAATLIAQIVATRVAQRHPKLATVERMTKNRPHGTVYVDYLQNILGKTVGGVYAARAKDAPTVSTPLRWDELTDDLDLRDFTIESVPLRVHRLGDLWGPAMAEPNSLEALREDRE